MSYIVRVNYKDGTYHVMNLKAPNEDASGYSFYAALEKLEQNEQNKSIGEDKSKFTRKTRDRFEELP